MEKNLEFKNPSIVERIKGMLSVDFYRLFHDVNKIIYRYSNLKTLFFLEQSFFLRYNKRMR